MMAFKRTFLNTLLATALTAGFAAAQDAPPPPDSQYPATSDSGQQSGQSTTAPGQYTTDSGQYATQESQTSQDSQQQDQGGYPQTAQSAPPPPQGQQDTQNNSDAQDPSARVARMQFMDGQVSIQPGGVNDWVAGTLNRPMTAGDNVWTDKDSKAELNVGTGIFRMGAETSVTLANIADKTTQLQVHQGTLNLRVRHLYDGEVYEVDTPNMAFTVQRPGDYRFDVDPNADTSYITVWKGEGNATGDGPAVEVREHEKARFSKGTSMAYEIDKAPGYDQFDQWAMSRDQREDNSVSAKYVSPDVIGSSDLDNYGTWKENPDYGNVWVPNDQGDDWQPYSDGNWIYEQPYGWTWVGYEPWGFAPYHYGRWVYGGWGWGWAPGPYAYWGSPYYAPALVGWFGGGFGFGIGFGGWGWCPLGWGEPFYPWYHGGRNYFRNVNIRNTRITNINNYYGRGYNSHYANASRGLVATNGRTVTNGLNVRNNRVRMNNTQRSTLLQHPVSAHMMGSQLHPTAQSRVGAQAASRHAVTPPTRAVSRPTYSRMTTPNRGGTNLNARGGMNTNARANAGVNTTRPSAAINSGRNQGGMNSSRSNAEAARNVPRPPSSGGQVSHGSGARANSRQVTPGSRSSMMNGATNRGPSANAGNGHYVPRPPSAGGTIGNRASAKMPSAMARSSSSAARPGGSTYSRPGQSYSAPSTHSVPRPSGPVSQPSRSYSAPSRSYSSPSYGRSYSAPNSSYGRGYGSPSYSRPSNPGYSARSYGSPNYGRSYSSPSYGGGRGYSAPSAPHYSAPSGGGHSSAPSYHGGGGGYSGGHSSGGGGHASGGGSGHASGGGGHSSGGRH